ncbi:unnamed protein product [Prunus armeniaca]
MEDQTDEDFFDRLVNDDIDFTGNVPSTVQNSEPDEVKAFSKLSISEAGSLGVDISGNGGFGVNGELGHEDRVVLESLDPLQDPVEVVKESKSPTPDSKNEFIALNDIADNGNEARALEDKADDRNEASALDDKASNGNEAKALEHKGEEGAVDGAGSTSIVSAETGVKVVQWSSFNSDLKPSAGNSDFFSEFGDYSEDPFANLGNTEKSWAESVVTNGVLENSVADLGASSYGQNQEGQPCGAIERNKI